MPALVYHFPARKTVKRIARKMKNRPKLFTARNKRWYPGKPKDIDVLIRWGTVTKSPKAKVIYNCAGAIKLASDKAKCREVLLKAGVSVPTPTENPPCVGRTRKHEEGNGFWFCETKGDVKKAKKEGAVYFSIFYPKTVEYRVHVVHNRVLLVSKKIGNPRLIIWNKTANNFKFKNLKWSKWPKKIIELAIKATKTARLDYGAVDIMAEPKDKRFKPAVVCEINTNPELGQYASKKYAQYFDWLLESDRRKYHIDDGGDYVFRERYLEKNE